MSFSASGRPVLVTGATGQVGTAFAKLLPDAVLVDRSTLDLAQPETVARVVADLDPGAVINCAAYTDVDGAEVDEATATDVNGTSVGELAVAANRLRIPFLTFSTDYVFDGTSSVPYVESDRTDPINAYGRSKLVGERLALANHPDALVVRTSWVVSGTHDNFVSTMLRLTADPNSTVRVVDDQHGCLTIADDLARASLAALKRGLSGLVHIANGPEASWFDIARFVVGAAGLEGTVSSCTTAEFPRPAPRPSYSVLGSDRLPSDIAAAIRPWKESVADVVDAQMVRLGL